MFHSVGRAWNGRHIGLSHPVCKQATAYAVGCAEGEGVSLTHFLDMPAGVKFSGLGLQGQRHC